MAKKAKTKLRKVPARKKACAPLAPKFKLLDGHHLKFAFAQDGFTYYEFADSNMAPCQRMFAAMDFYNEFKMRVDRDYLIAHFKAMRDVLSKPIIDIVGLSQLILQGEERLEWIFEPETAYKYASVIFIECDSLGNPIENPYSYDFKYGKEKIERWKKQMPASFFLSMPVARLFPLGDISEKDLNQYLETLEKMNKEQISTIFTMLSSKHKTTDWFNSLESRTQEESPLAK
jgi:hypothetical protein